MDLQRLHSQRGRVLFPHWVIVSLARFHKAQRLKETFIPTAGVFFNQPLLDDKARLFFLKGRLLRNKGRLFTKRRFVAFDTPYRCPWNVVSQMFVPYGLGFCTLRKKILLPTEKTQKTFFPKATPSALHFKTASQLSLGLSAFTMDLQRLHSQHGKVLFPHWVIISLARFHKAQRLKECLM